MRAINASKSKSDLALTNIIDEIVRFRAIAINDTSEQRVRASTITNGRVEKALKKPLSKKRDRESKVPINP